MKFFSLNFRQTKNTNHVLVGIYIYIFIFSLSDCVYILVLEECLYHSLNLKCLMIIFANRGEKSFSQQSNVVSLSFSLQYVIMIRMLVQKKKKRKICDRVLQYLVVFQWKTLFFICKCFLYKYHNLSYSYLNSLFKGN